MQNLHLLEYSAEESWCQIHHHQAWQFQWNWGSPSIYIGAHGTAKFLLNTQESEDFA
jgi:hypothetical protein